MTKSPLRIVEKPEPVAGGPITDRKASIVGRLHVFGLCALLVFGVLAFGSVEEWSMHIFEIAAVVLFALWAGKQLQSKQMIVSSNPIYLPALLLFALVMAQLVFHRTAYWYVSKYEALQLVAYGIVILITAECVSEDNARRSFALIMVIFGGLYAFFALIQSLTSPGKIYWVYTPRFGRDVFGSYVNRDHYAGLIEMLAPLPLVLCTGHLVHGGKRVLIAFGGVLMAGTIFVSGSRAGISIFFAQLVLFAVFTFRLHRNSRALLGSVAAFALVGMFLIFFGKWQFLSRFGNLDAGIRASITKDSLRIFLHHPILGWGLGTFPTIYPSYRSFYTNLFVNAAHNDYAQLIVETGLLGFALMIWFVTMVYRRGLAAMPGWQLRWDAAVSFGALLGCSGILLHSLVDFNLQIPANAAMFYALCALAASRLPARIPQSKLQYRQASAPERMSANRSKIK